MSDYSTGLELILNACEGCLQIVVTGNEKPLCFQQWNLPRQATELLAPALQEICKNLKISPADFKRIGCFAGPGSFTGIRLVLATAAAMRRASHAQLASLDYLQALATSAVKRRGLLYPGKVFVVTHARRDLLHFQEYISYGPVIPAQPLREARLVAPQEAFNLIGDAQCLICGSGLGRHPDLFDTPITGQGPAGAPLAIPMPELIHPDLDALCLLARHGDYFPNDVEPKYTRPCDAVEHLIETKGPDSKEARELENQLRLNLEHFTNQS